MKPILLGMNNPLSDDPADALVPWPVGCSGHRLYRVLADVRPGTTEDDYTGRFDRRNLLRIQAWNGADARAAASAFAGSLPPGSVVVALGEGVRRALGLPRMLVHPWRHSPGVTVRQLPHPSGRNPWYGHPAHRLLAGLLLAELYDGALE